eukprot:3208918-Pyramimonas_sp.AAC.1
MYEEDVRRCGGCSGAGSLYACAEDLNLVVSIAPERDAWLWSASQLSDRRCIPATKVNSSWLTLTCVGAVVGSGMG